MSLTALLFTALEGFLKDLSQTRFALSTSLLFTLGAADARNRKGLYLKTQPECFALPSRKRRGDHFQLRHRALKRSLSTALCLAPPILLLRKQITPPVARARSKLLVLMLLMFSPGFEKRGAADTTRQRRTAAETPARTLTKTLVKSLACTRLPPSL